MTARGAVKLIRRADDSCVDFVAIERLFLDRWPPPLELLSWEECWHAVHWANDRGYNRNQIGTILRVNGTYVLRTLEQLSYPGGRYVRAS